MTDHDYQNVPLSKTCYLACVLVLFGFCQVYGSKEAAEAAHPGASAMRIGPPQQGVET